MEGCDRSVIAVNTTYRMAPWADALFAMDYAWWAGHIKDVRDVFRGEKYSINNIGKQFSDVMAVPKPFTAFGNSGAGAIALAAKFKAAKVVLLGYDCQHTGGQRHWHGNHPKGLGNADSVKKWHDHFSKLRGSLSVDVINCTRQTALTVFRVGVLEEELSCKTPQITRPLAHCRQRLFD